MSGGQLCMCIKCELVLPLSVSSESVWLDQEVSRMLEQKQAIQALEKVDHYMHTLIVILQRVTY